MPFLQLVIRMACELDVNLTNGAETPIAMSGILADSNHFLRGNTDVHGAIQAIQKDRRNVIASQLNSASAFNERTVLYRDSCIHALAAMYAYNCPTFLASQKQLKPIVLDSSSDCILTYPFKEAAS
jgi:hypothetical protein